MHEVLRVIVVQMKNRADNGERPILVPNFLRKYITGCHSSRTHCSATVWPFGGPMTRSASVAVKKKMALFSINADKNDQQ